MIIVAIRISGRVGVDRWTTEILNNIRLRQKYACVLIKDKQMLEKVKDKLAYGEIDHDTLKILISKRARKPGDKPLAGNVDSIIKSLEEGKSLKELGLKPFFRLSPPVGGFKKSTKTLYPRGILGENKDINSLVRRMA